MSQNQHNNQEIISGNTVKRIRCSVVAGHLLVVMLTLTMPIITEWLDREEETITIQFYDPELDNIIENASPLPDPANPVPPTGTQDGGAESEPEPEAAPEPEVEVEVAPPEILQPEPAQVIAQPQVVKRKLPKPVINRTLPKVKTPPKAAAIKQPKVKKRKLPKSLKKPGSRKASAAQRSNSNGSRSNRSRGPLGSNSEPGHNAPGGQRGNSGYDALVGRMIKQMWVTPDIDRLGGRQPRVIIDLEIAADGRIISKRIRVKSNVLAMDESVAALLNSLRYVRAPFDGKPHKFTFALKAD